jgi:two-component system, OmpR family, response regulator
MGARRVLVIEDEASAREALASLLREEGFVVRSAPSGEAGIRHYVDFHPDVVLCDYYLPDIDGLQVLRRIRAHENGSTHFVMLTAGMSCDESELALRREADAFLGKPIDLGQLHSALEGRRTPPAGVRP